MCLFMVLDNYNFNSLDYIGSNNFIVNNEFDRKWKDTDLAYVMFEGVLLNWDVIPCSLVEGYQCF